jgi:FkbM family methyltransferase
LRKYLPPIIILLIKRILSFFTWDPWANHSWSQEGEDRILYRIFEQQSVGFYVDVGAHHPKRFSNTYFFYRRGWRGINIDAMPGSMKIFEKLRPRDINLEYGISNSKGKLDYYIFNESALNGFSKELSKERDNDDSTYQINEIIKVEVLPLSVILNCQLPEKQIIDFMSIDVEGLDYEVLISNDWSKYRPKYVLTEVLDSSLHEIEKSQIGKFMKNVGYFLYAKCIHTVIFKEFIKNNTY